jgi:tetratricopeptide (TPR) repeat protein
MENVDLFTLVAGMWLVAGVIVGGILLLEQGVRLRVHLVCKLWLYGHSARSRGWFSTSALLTTVSERILPFPPVRAEAAMRLYYEGKLDEASQVLGTISVFDDPRGVLAAIVVNDLICVDVAMGCYLRALDRRRQWSLEGDHPIIRINEAEALANLGRWEESLEHLQGLLETTGLTLTGAALHNAWVLAMQDRAASARVMFALAHEQDLPIDFRSEYHYAEAFVLLAERDNAGARRATQRGEALAIRASSQRNALFLLGRISLQEGRPEEALEHFEAGARHVFRGQGGDGLLAWGDALASLGRHEQAIEAWKLVRARDPESYAVSIARERCCAPTCKI